MRVRFLSLAPWGNCGCLCDGSGRLVRGEIWCPMVLNINVPGVPRDDVKGVHWADLDDFGTFRVAIAEDSRLQFVLGSPDNNSDPGCDTVLCSENHVTITPLSGVEPAPFPKEDAGVVAGYATSGTG